MNRNTLHTLVILAALLAGAGCSRQGGDHGVPSAAPSVVKGVAVEIAHSEQLPDTLEVVGTVRARTSAIVSARVPGSIALLRVREGDRVKRGDLLARIDARESQAAAAGAAAGSDEAQRALEEARSRKILADATFDRYQKMFSEQAVTRQEYDVKLAERDLAAQGVARAEARLRQAQEGAAGASAVAGYTRVVAPVSGIVTARQVDLGATVFPAQPLFTIEDEGSYQLELSVPEGMAAKVRPGMAVQVTLDAVNSSVKTTVAEIVPSADPGSRTFIAKVNLTQKGLRSGMFGRGTLVLGSSSQGMQLIKTAVVERGALTSVWVVDKDATARMRLVKTGKAVGGRVEILSGLSDGERVIVSGVEKVREGAKVE